VVDEYHRLAYQNYGIGIEYIVNYILEIGVKVVNDLYDDILADITERLNQKSIATNLRGLSSSASRFALIATTYIIVMEAINKKDNDVESSLTTDVDNADEESLAEDARIMWQKINSSCVWENEDEIKLLTYKADKYYVQLVDYLIDNLVDKMKVVTYEVDIYRNLIDFLSSKENDKWFIETNPNDFFANYKKTHIAYKKQVGNKIEIYFLGKKNVEWLMCSGIALSDEQIKEYLSEVNQKSGKYKELAEVFWGSKITKINFEEKINTYPLLNFRIEDRINSARNIGVLSVTIPVMKDNEEQAQ